MFFFFLVNSNTTRKRNLKGNAEERLSRIIFTFDFQVIKLCSIYKVWKQKHNKICKQKKLKYKLTTTQQHKKASLYLNSGKNVSNVIY